ncbi:hypothetical protein GGI11_005569 [Coemansia sp. RSA 2049]|nr:hypothetical protein GGI11_005569 [Coemansia sp. RSA 2049]
MSSATDEEILRNVPGLEEAARSLLEVIQYPQRHRAKFERLGIEAPKGVLLHGPPGVGKTRLVQQVAKLSGVAMTTVQGSEILSPYLGESERRLRELFGEAQSNALASSGTSVLFIDEIDALVGDRRRQSERGEGGVKMVAQLLTLMDGVGERGQVVVIGATNQPNALDPALRRPGRFDREILVDVPGVRARCAILAYYVVEMPTDATVDLDALAAMTSGYVGADLGGLCRAAAQTALSAVGRQTVAVTMRDFGEAMRRTVPALRRGLAVDTGNCGWDDIGGLEALKTTLRRIVGWQQEQDKGHGAALRRLGVRQPRGVLLYGPPGCSKTTVARALATQDAAFFSVNGAAVYSPYVGDAERTVRSVFRQARAAAPSVVFLDEVDAVVGRRTVGGSEDSVRDRVLATLLNEMDGVEDARGVVVVGATNRVDLLDPALLRPGRFDRVVYVGPPDAAARAAILRIKTRTMPLALAPGDIEELAQLTTGFSGADLESLCREAAFAALRCDLQAAGVARHHFDQALSVVAPSLTPDMLRAYEAAYASFGGGCC